MYNPAHQLCTHYELADEDNEMADEEVEDGGNGEVTHNMGLVDDNLSRKFPTKVNVFDILRNANKQFTDMAT